MAQYGEQKYGSQTDEYGNPVSHTGQHGTTGVGHGGMQYGTTEAGVGMQHGTTGVAHGGMQHGMTGTTMGGEQQGQHRRSGSGSSSSSEDDGQGGRRKKGLKDKIKEKLPGGQTETEQAQGTATMEPGMGEQQEKKGIMDKIKEKLPGH